MVSYPDANGINLTNKKQNESKTLVKEATLALPPSSTIEGIKRHLSRQVQLPKNLSILYQYQDASTVTIQVMF